MTSFSSSSSQPLAPQELDHVPAAAAKLALKLLYDLAVAAHRPVQPLQVAIDHEDQVVELFARREADGAKAFGLVHLAVAKEAPDLAVGHVDQPAIVHVFHEPGLVDRHQRPQPHADGRKLPVIGHQPGVRIARQAVAPHLGAEIIHLFLRQAPFHERARIDARAPHGPERTPDRRHDCRCAPARNG